MSILLLAEHDNKTLSGQTAKALTAAAAISGDIDILICGKAAESVAQAAASLKDVRKVLLAQSDALAHQLAEPVAATILSVADQYDTIIAAATTTGKNVMPRVAALLDVMQISDVIEVVSPTVFKHPIYTGNAIETVETNEPKKVITVRTTAFKAAEQGGNGTVESVTAAADPDCSRFVSHDMAKSERPELTAANVVVSGGRALGSAEQFIAVLSPLADKLNAALGASRAAVDAGYAPNDWQVGQTGKMVAPDLYIAAGISGAIQHVAGMQDSRIIVAINKDSEAPIMQTADFAIVGDLFEIVPQLTKIL